MGALTAEHSSRVLQTESVDWFVCGFQIGDCLRLRVCMSFAFSARQTLFVPGCSDSKHDVQEPERASTQVFLFNEDIAERLCEQGFPVPIEQNTDPLLASWKQMPITRVATYRLEAFLFTHGHN